MKIIYNFIIILVYHALLYSQGIDFPNEPVQAPISGLWLLIAGGATLAYRKLKKQEFCINPFLKFLIKGFLFYVIYIFFYDTLLLNNNDIESKIINLQVIISSIFLNLFGLDVYCDESMLFIKSRQPLNINPGCNFLKHLHNFLFFFVSYPSTLKRMYKYIFICLIYLSFIQIIRIMSFVICLKFFPNYWDFFHLNSAYLFYYPGILLLWYLFSSKPNVYTSKY